MGHVLQFDEQTRKVKDANMQDEDTFEIYDPRNPVNKRRREESKKLMKEKKAKRWKLLSSLSQDSPFLSLYTAHHLALCLFMKWTATLDLVPYQISTLG